MWKRFLKNTTKIICNEKSGSHSSGYRLFVLQWNHRLCQVEALAWLGLKKIHIFKMKCQRFDKSTSKDQLDAIGKLTTWFRPERFIELSYFKHIRNLINICENTWPRYRISYHNQKKRITPDKPPSACSHNKKCIKEWWPLNYHFQIKKKKLKQNGNVFIQKEG